MPNLRGASPVGRDDGGLPSEAQSFSSGKPSWEQRGRGDGVGLTYVARQTVDVDRVLPNWWMDNGQRRRAAQSDATPDQVP